MEELNVCVICGASDNLNTDMTIVVDDKKIKIKVCDVHADDITPKAAREAYTAKKAEIDAILAAAAKYGLKLQTPGTSKLAILQQEPSASATPQKTAVIHTKELDGDNVIPTSVIDSKIQSIKGVSGVIGNHRVEGQNAHNLQNVANQLPVGATEGKVKMALVEGRSGQLMAIPSVRQDKLGTTVISVSKSVTDADIQRRLRRQQSLGDSAHCYGPDGYDIHNCTMCGGATTIINKGERIPCPKCNGAGLLNR